MVLSLPSVIMWLRVAGLVLLSVPGAACVSQGNPHVHPVSSDAMHAAPDGHAWQDPDDRSWFYEGLSQAQSTPDALNARFMDRLGHLAPDAPEHGIFLDHLRLIHWQDSPAAHTYISRHWPGFYADWLERHSLTLYVHARDNQALAQALTGELLDSLPPHVRLVRSPRRAEAVLEVTSKPVSFRESIKKSKIREKKYPKRLWKHQLVRCDRMERARFTEQTRLVHAHHDVRLTLLLRGRIAASDRVQGTVKRTYKVGHTLQAVTPCGVKDTSVFPGNGVKSLFDEHQNRARAHDRLQDAIADRVAKVIAAMPMPPGAASRRY